jgi:hypothetical protein
MTGAFRIVATAAGAALIALAAAGRRVDSEFPWLPGFIPTSLSTERSSDAAARLAIVDQRSDHCSTWDAHELRADVAPAEGTETVLASVATGVVVLDARGRRLASTPLGECGGSADDIVALAAGDAWVGTPVIAVVSSTGGHRESQTSLTLLRVDGDYLTTVFTGTLETRDGEELETGAAVLAPGVILYRPPTGPLTVVRLQRALGAEPAR